MRRLCILALLTLPALSACERHSDKWGVTEEESDGLNNAAAILDAAPSKLAVNEMLANETVEDENAEVAETNAS